MLSTLDKIHIILKTIATTATISNISGYEDMAKSLENFTKSLFKVLDNKDFGQPTILKCNNGNVEFVANDGTEYQVTTNNNFKAKCEKTIITFLENKQAGHTLQIVYYVLLSGNDKTKKKQLLSQYPKDVSIYDVEDICRKIAQCDDETVNKIFNICMEFYPIDFSNYALDTFTNSIKLCDDYIDRSFNVLNNNSFLKIESIDDLLKQYRNIVIMADASAGKTELLIKINNSYYDKQKCVYYYQLKNYNGKEIIKYLPKPFLLHPTPLLLLDGFDEIESVHVDNFIKELNTFTQIYPDCKVVITSRKNFCTRNMFDNFSYCELNDLTDTEIDAYFKDKFDEKHTEKINLCKTLNIYNLLYNPFYLTRIVKVLSLKDNLSNRSDIMKATFELDYNKYKYNKEISSETLLCQLTQFAMFLFQKDKSNCDISDYKQFDNDKMRAFSWLLYQDDKISFVHNNFKEFLIALRLSEFPVSKIIKIITLKLDKPYIKTKYTNILSFMLSSYKNDKLFDYVLKYGQYIILDLEESSLTEKQKIQIIEKIYKEYELKKSWPNAYLYNERKLAKICDTKKIIEILISKLKPKNHRTTIVFSIELLKEVPSLFGFTNKLKELVIQWLNDDCLDEVVLSSLIYSLNKLNASIEEVSSIYLKYRNHKYSRIRASVNYLLKEYKLATKFIPEVIEGFSKGQLKVLDVNHKEEDVIDAGESYYLQQAISEIRDENALEQLLDFIIENERKYETRSFTEYVFQALENKRKIGLKLQEKLYTLLSLTCLHYTDNLLNLTLNLIYKFKLNNEFMSKIFSDTEIKEYQKNLLIARLYTDESIFKCLDYFKSQTKQQIENFIYYLKEYNKNYADVISLLKAEGISCSLPKNDYELQRQKAIQTHFNNLFFKEKVIAIVRKILKDLNGDEISRKKVREHYLYSDYKLPFYIYSLFDIDSNNFNEKKILKQVTDNWQISQIYDMLHHNKQLELKSKQIDFINKWVVKQLEVIDFKNAITYNGTSWSTSYNAMYTEYFIRKCDLLVDNNIYEDMLCFTWGENSDSDISNLEFIEQKLGSENFKSKLSEFSKKDFLDGYVLSNRLRYCMKKDYDILFDCVIKKISNLNKDETDYHSSIYFEYLNKFGRLASAYDFYDNLPINLKLELIHMSLNQNLDNKFILDHTEKDISLNDENSIKIAKALLPHRSSVALKYYYKTIHKDGFEISYPYPTLKAYQDKKYFKTLFKILALTYKYKDEDNHTRNDLMFCFEKICINSNLKTVKYIIKKLNRFTKISKYENVNYLHYYLDGIKLQIITQKDA